MLRVAIVFGTTLFLLSGCSKSTISPEPQAEDSVTVALVSVETGASATEQVASGLAVAGTVRLKRETPLAFNTNGRVAQILVTEGQNIVAGQMLARLDPTAVDAAFAAARAESSRALNEYNRLDQLMRNGWITKPRLESASATLAAARSRVAQAGFDVRYAQIVAPAAGVILQRHVEPGQVVGVGQAVITLGETAAGYVLRLPMTDSQAAKMHLGQSAMVEVPALGPAPGNAAIPATISEIAARSDDRTGTFQVELRLPAVSGLRSGLIGQARIAGLASVSATTAVRQISVPATAIFAARADEGFVYVYDASTGRVQARLVGLGAIDDERVIITRGLVAGEKVARSGVDRLRDGMKVRIAA